MSTDHRFPHNESLGGSQDPTLSYDSTDCWHFTDTLATHGARPSAGWEYVFVFKAPHWTNVRPSRRQLRIDKARRQVLHDLAAASFSYSQIWTPSTGQIFVRTSLTEDTMMQKAEDAQVPLRVRSSLGGGYLPFTVGNAHVFENEGRRLRNRPYFTPSERLSITQQTLRSNEPWGAGVNINSLKQKSVLNKSFALHARRERDVLLHAAVKHHWWNLLRNLPLYALQEYFGPRVALYLAWILFYTHMLTGFALLSIPVYFVIAYAPWLQVRMWTQLGFGIAICFWGSYWLQVWQRRNEIINVRWGLQVSDDREQNAIRDDFHGINSEGFYSVGGFVHLNDLADSPVGNDNRESDRESDEEDPSFALARTESRTQPQEYYEDDVESEDSYIDDVTQRIESERTTLASLVCNERAHWQDAAPIPGDNDATELRFADLPVYPFCSRKIVRRRMWVTSFITFFFALIVAALTFCILFFRTEMNIFFGINGQSGPLAGIITALLIIAGDKSWKVVSRKLTRWENHHTNQDYENSLISKRFAFQFVSNYLSLFYIAFVKPFTPHDPCLLNDAREPDCMQELLLQIASIVITKATLDQVIELLIPTAKSIGLRIIQIPSQLFLRVRLRFQRGRRDEERNLLLVSQGATLTTNMLNRRPQNDTYTEQDDIAAMIDESRRLPYKTTIADYSEITIQHGYLILFGIAFPPAALIHLLNNAIEIRTDAYKLLRIHQRPEVDSASSIGKWLPILKVLSSMSIVTTVALLTITTPTLQVVLSDLLPASVGKAAFEYPFVCFLIAEHVLLAVRWVVTSMIATEPAATHRMRARQSFLLARCFGLDMKPFYHSRGRTSSCDEQHNAAPGV